MKRGGKKDKRKDTRKGISPLIATVSLVGISIVLFGIIFLWSRGFVKEKVLKFGKNIESFCESVGLEVTVTPDEQDSNILDFTLNNIGNVNIYQIKVIYYTESGQIPREYPAGEDEGNERALPAGDVSSYGVNVGDVGGGDIEKLEVIPVLEGVGKESGKPYVFPCENKKSEIILK